MALLVVVVVGVLLGVALAARDSRSLAFTLGVVPQQVAVTVAPGQEGCQAPIEVPAEFSAVELEIGTYQRPGPPLSMVVRGAKREVVARGRLARGYADNSLQAITVAPMVTEGARVSVCVTNRGRANVALYGGPDLAARTSTASLDGQPAGTDISLVFLRSHPASSLSLLPAIFRRAALFRLSWVGAWTLWLLAAAVTLLVPLLLALAVRAAAGDRSEAA